MFLLDPLLHSLSPLTRLTLLGLRVGPTGGGLGLHEGLAEQGLVLHLLGWGWLDDDLLLYWEAACLCRGACGLQMGRPWKTWVSLPGQHLVAVWVKMGGTPH